MVRSYLVIPAGAMIETVDACRPEHAAGKARRGKTQRVTLEAPLVVACSAAHEVTRSLAVTRGQLAFDEQHV